VSPPALTISQVNKAGKTLRKWLNGDIPHGPDVDAAFDNMLLFRAAHQGPLTKGTVSLRWRVKREGCPMEVSQRLKRVGTIMDKLYREPTMQLANMQDIGGCRAVLATIDDVRRLQRRMHKGSPPPLREYDYITKPRDSGYRGVHVIVPYDGRQIEIQLRTRVMHEWAIYVERLGGRLRADLKSGQGPREVLDWLEAASEAMALEESGQVVDTDRVERISALRQRALPYMEGGHG
jgi:GTP pyrophosphokinase